MAPHPQCWKLFRCDRADCPAHGRDDVRCWLTAGTHCRAELRGQFLDKMEVCLACDVFRSHVESPAMSETFAIIHEQFREYRRTIEEKNRELEELAAIDHVTRVYNRRKFADTLEFEFERASCCGQALSVVMLDVDRFKEINDNCGHAIGDHALKVVAETAQRRLREPDMLFRFGGDEFVILLPKTALAGAVDVAEDLRQRIAGQTFDTCATLTASFGVAAYRTDDSAIALVKRADQALYQAKAKGRNRVEQEA